VHANHSGRFSCQFLCVCAATEARLPAETMPLRNPQRNAWVGVTVFGRNADSTKSTSRVPLGLLTQTSEPHMKIPDLVHVESAAGAARRNHSAGMKGARDIIDGTGSSARSRLHAWQFAKGECRPGVPPIRRDAGRIADAGKRTPRGAAESRRTPAYERHGAAQGA